MTGATLPALSKAAERVFSGGASALLILGARLLQNANGFLMTAIVAHLYGLGAVGTLTLATVVTTLVAVFGTFGLQFRLAQIEASAAARNSLGLISVAVSLPVVAVLAAAFGLGFGHDATEQFNLVILALSSPFFAQTSVTTALQVLQGRKGQCIVAPAMNALGLAAGALMPDFTSFCLTVLVFRWVGTLLPYMLLPHDFGAVRRNLGQLWAGTRYLMSDAMLVLSDNLILLLSSNILTRSELGILGICRQLLTASDTPGWANLQSIYPKLVAGDARYFRSTAQSMMRLGVILGALVAALAVPAGMFIFNVPDLWFYASLLMVSVPARYAVLTVETYLKAKGAVSFVSWLTALRGSAAIVAVYLATLLGALPGHILGVAAFFIVLAVIEIALVSRGTAASNLVPNRAR